jgi:cold-inducible RNA-binding protein
MRRDAENGPSCSSEQDILRPYPWERSSELRKPPEQDRSMSTKLFVGNLSFDATEDDLQDLFAQAGSVNSVTIMQDRATGRPRGFGFVEMATEADTAKAISMLSGKDFKGRALTVNEARPREERAGADGGSRAGASRGYSGRR